MVGVVKRWRAALAASILAIATALVAGSCWSPLNWALWNWSQLDMVKVQGGSLWLGSDDPLPNYYDENPPHLVSVSTFFMSRYEVTQQLYCWITGEYPSYFATRGGYTDDFSRPVESVTWLDAVNFCNDLSTFTGFMPCYAIDELTGVVTCDFTADGYRLPTEAEWEYAARGGTANDGYYFLYAGSDDPSEVAWWGDPTGTTHPVGYKGSNELGLYDMTGNVYEWCWDTYDDTYYSWPTVVWFDPIGPGGIYAYDAANFPGYYMVVRGGSFGNGADPGLDWLRNPGRSYRAQEWANSASSIIGFRVVRRL